MNPLIARSALLVALARVYPESLTITKLDETLPEWEEVVEQLQRRGLDVLIEEGGVRLASQVYFDLYQSVPPEIAPEVEGYVWELIGRPEIRKEPRLPQILIAPQKEARIAILTERGSPRWITEQDVHYTAVGDKRFPLACIHCADPLCQTSGVEAFGVGDWRPSQICPSDVINIDDEGRVSIDREGCTGCLICLFSCPVGAINIADGTAWKREYDAIGWPNDFVTQLQLLLPQKRKATQAILRMLSPVVPSHLPLPQIRYLLDNFDQRVSGQGLNWDQDPYYIWVRNCLKLLGLEAAYTGSKGQLKRADVTVTSPFFAGIEVKSPAEGDINVGAIRQAAEASMEVSETYHSDAWAAVIGQGITRGAHKKAHQWQDRFNIAFPLIRGRYLLYLLIKHRTGLPLDPEADVQRLFRDFTGWFGKRELHEFYRLYFETRRQEIEAGENVLPLPSEAEKFRDAAQADRAMELLDRLLREVAEEIDVCFDDPDREARGGYST